ncbi:IclR family transcriptional regulator [Hydrogenophaga crassostreae]|uniref:IclR family transcriptional regulator n=1 Tax=Hydrogenophaga crassostreae TaxID=1763535 RepID=A0A163C9L8_9BURK|nr:uracil-DNA glycosylase family protein [Hydrogenophaga crassostreae]AOW12480.1 IclR family transcriptional regulator [Hydrogenophaga crassostreae]OAD40344.1 IclR family transcriptional regulator [Hydrogenophaga crassostreae]
MSTGHSQGAPAPNLPALLREVRACTLCAPYLPLGPRPVLQARATSRILIAGQAPGRKVHASGVPFDDASGERLRRWMGVSRDTFYDPQCCAILPMGFCYPGTGRSGDLPPRPECAPTWRTTLLAAMPQVQLTLVIGQYAMAYHLPQHTGTLTEAVQDWRSYGPGLMPLPHPSPRNNGWIKHNPWFDVELLPVLRARVAAVLG